MSKVMSPAFRAESWKKLEREIITPEGIALRFQLAPASDRAAAFLIDVVIQIGAVALVAFLFALAVGGAHKGSWLEPLVILLAFFVVNFYFVFFEARWQGSTPGKRRIGLRVIDARGGHLETSAILARNLVRELEVWTPLRLLFAGGLLWPDAPGWAIVVAIAWTVVLLLLPVFNKDKLRIGDLVAGTRVVIAPRTVLLPDLATETSAAAPTTTFTAAQLSIYGVYELQVLEDLLRQPPSNFGYAESVRTVAERIRAKIDYKEAVADDERFLREFYVALRAHQEQKLLLGKRRADKHAPHK